MKKFLFYGIGILIVLGIGSAIAGGTSRGSTGGTGSTHNGGTASDNGGVSKGLGSNDASADVSMGDCSSSYGVLTCTINIVNHSDGTSDYYVEAEIDDSDGTNVGTANGLAQHVAAGQHAKSDLTGAYSGNGKVTVKITQVQRTASN